MRQSGALQACHRVACVIVCSAITPDSWMLSAMAIDGSPPRSKWHTDYCNGCVAAFGRHTAHHCRDVSIHSCTTSTDRFLFYTQTNRCVSMVG